MARPKNDGKGRLGGRVKGTPNKPKPSKAVIDSFVCQYLNEGILDAEGNVATFGTDLLALCPKDRIDVLTKVLKFVMPAMQAVSAEVSVDADKQSFAQKLASLAGGNN